MSSTSKTGVAPRVTGNRRMAERVGAELLDVSSLRVRSVRQSLEGGARSTRETTATFLALMLGRFSRPPPLNRELLTW